MTQTTCSPLIDLIGKSFREVTFDTPEPGESWRPKLTGRTGIVTEVSPGGDTCRARMSDGEVWVYETARVIENLIN